MESLHELLTLALAALGGYAEYKRRKARAELERERELRAERERELERVRREAGLIDEGGGSRAGHEAKEEWLREQAARARARKK